MVAKYEQGVATVGLDGSASAMAKGEPLRGVVTVGSHLRNKCVLRATLLNWHSEPSLIVTTTPPSKISGEEGPFFGS